MTRQIYLHRLKEALEGLPREEQESAMRYCEEYFDEAGEDQFDQAVPRSGLAGGVCERDPQQLQQPDQC